MLGCGDGTTLDGGGHECAASERTGTAEQAAGTLVDGGNGVGREERLGPTGDRNMVVDVFTHVLTREGFYVAAADDAGSKRAGSVEEELVDEGDLTREDDGYERARVEIGLCDRVELVEDVEPEEMGFVDDENGNLFLCEDVGEEIADKGEHLGNGA